MQKMRGSAEKKQSEGRNNENERIGAALSVALKIVIL
jgi:hypothetical protein